MNPLNAKSVNWSFVDRSIEILGKIIKHRAKHPTTPDDLMYYEIQLKYYENVRHAHEQGKYLVCHSPLIPSEIIYGMDMVPWHLSMSTGTLANCLKNHDDYVTTCDQYGLPWECCAAHRQPIGAAIMNVLPPFDFIVGLSTGCDNVVKSAQVTANMFEIPYISLDLPYNSGERDVAYTAREFEELIDFLEKGSGKKMDWDRFAEFVDRSVKLHDYWVEIGELRKAVPEPMRHRSYIQQYVTEMMTAGSEEALDYFRAVRDHLKENVEKGVGYAREEKYRIVTIQVPITQYLKLMDWMEEDFGAVSVMDVHLCNVKPVKVIPNKPLETVVNKTLNRPMACQLRSSSDEWIDETIRIARDYKADFILYYASVTCHTTPAVFKLLKDRVYEALKIPTFKLDCDLSDPSYMPMEVYQTKLEEMFSLIDT